MPNIEKGKSGVCSTCRVFPTSIAKSFFVLKKSLYQERKFYESLNKATLRLFNHLEAH